MNKNLYQKELKRNRKNLITWTAIIVGFTLMVLSMFPYMEEMGSNMTQLLDKMPEEIKNAMGMDKDTWSSILGFYSTYYGIYIVVLISIYTTSTATGIVSKEEKDKTSEFLLSKPITRSNLFLTKMASLFTLVFIVYVVQLLVAAAGAQIFKTSPMNWNAFWIMHINGLFLILLFTSVGVLLSMFVQPKKNFMGIVVGLTFGSYFINALAKATPAANWIGYITPFNYFNFNVHSPDLAVNYLAAIVTVAISMLLLFVAKRKFETKDIAC